MLEDYPYQIPLNPNKQSLKIKNRNWFRLFNQYFFKKKKTRNRYNRFEDEYSSGKSKQSPLEIYDLNFKVIYSQRAIGTNSARTDQFGKPKHQTN
jgi:hypothetical protein